MKRHLRFQKAAIGWAALALLIWSGAAAGQDLKVAVGKPRQLSVIYDLDVGSFPKLNGAWTVCVSGDIACVGGYEDDAVTFVDVSDPTSPKFLSQRYDGSGSFTKLDGVRSVFISGNTAYVASYNDNSLTLMDISNPANPGFLSQIYDADGEFNRLWGAQSVFVSGNTAYVASIADGSLTIIDVSNPTNPALLSEVYDGDGEFSLLNGASSVFVSGNTAYVASSLDHSLTVMDVSDPSNPTLLAEVYDGDGEFNKLGGACGVCVSGAIAYVTSADDDSLTLMDVSKPTDPDLLSEIWEGDGEFNLLNGVVGSPGVSGNTVYVASFFDNAVTAIDVSDPTDPVLLSEVYDGDGEFARLAGARMVCVSGTRAYVAASTDDSMTTLDLRGGQLGNLKVGSARIGGLQAMDAAQFDNDVHIKGGVSAARGRVEGDFAIRGYACIMSALGVGTSAPTERLEVKNGNIRVSGGSFIDDGTTLNVPDYVFDDPSALMSLPELRAYVEREGHLPGVPSADDIRREGLNLSQFNMKLLEKVEETTLYLMEQQTRIEEQQKRAAGQDRRIAELEAQIKALMAEKRAQAGGASDDKQASGAAQTAPREE